MTATRHRPSWMTRWPLRYTVPGALLLFVLLGGLMAFSYELRLERARIISNAELDLRTFGILQAQVLRSDLLRGDLTGVRSQVAALALDRNIVRARLQSPTGVVVASTALGEIGRSLPQAGPPATGATVNTGGEVVQVVVPLRGQALDTSGTELGQFVLERDLAPRLHATTERMQRAFARYLGYFLVIALLMWMTFERVVWRRLRALGETVERIANGELGLRADVSGGDEVAEAARMGNRAADQLERSDALNRRLTRALERLALPDPAVDLFDAIAAAVADGLGSRWAMIARRGAGADDMLIVGAAGDGPWHRGMRYRPAGTPCGTCMAAPDGMLVVARDVTASFPHATLLGDCGAESWRGIVIRSGSGEALGVLSVIDDHADDDTIAVRPLLQTAAGRIAQEFARLDHDARLAERDQRLSLAMEVSEVSLAEWNVDDDDIRLRGNWRERFDLRAQTGRLRLADWLAAVHPADLPAFESIVDTLRHSNEPTARLDYRMRARDGSWRWVRGRAQVSARDDAGAPRIVVSVQADIHDLRETEEHLRVSETRLRLALEAGGLSMAHWDIPSDRFEIGRQWCELLGYGEGEIAPRRSAWVALVHPDDRPRLDAHALAQMQGDLANEPIEYRLRTKQGDWRWVRTQAMVVARDDDGRALQMIGVQADVHAAKLAAEALREQTEFLELAVRGASDGLWDWHFGAGEIYLSPRLHELMGYPEGVLPTRITALIENYMHPDDHQVVDEALARIGQGDTRIEHAVRVRRADGQWRWFEVRGLAVRDAAGTLRRLVGSMSEIHDRHVRDAELAQVRQMMSEAIESIDGGLLRLDADDRVLMINSRYLDLYDLPRDRDYLGVSLEELVRLYYTQHPDMLEGCPVEERVAERIRLHRERAGLAWDYPLGDRWVLVSDTPTADGGRVCLRTDITSVQQLQLALNERKEYLELVVRGTADALWSWDGDVGTDLYLSPRVYELLGYQAGGIPLRLDRFEAEIYHPDDQPRIRAAVAHLLNHPEDGDVLLFEGRFRCGNGGYRWFRNRAAMLRRPDGSLRRFAGSISDIHERRLREQELQVAQQRLSDAIETIDSGLLISDADDRLVLCNRRYREMYGFAPELLEPGTPLAALARDLMIRFPEYAGNRPLDEAVAERLAKHHAHSERWELALGGHWYQISDRKTADGGTVSLRTDITHLKEVEQQLRERSEFFEAAMRGSMDGIYDVDLASSRAYFAPRFHELLGYADGELPTTWAEFTAAHFHPDDEPERVAALRRIGAGEDEFMSREMRLRRKDGGWGWYHARAMVMRGPDGAPYRLIGSMSDTQARHEHEEELAQARQQLQDAIESLDVGIVMFDRDERLVLCNRRMIEMYGQTSLELKPGVRYEDAIRAYFEAHPDHRQGRDVDTCVAESLQQHRTHQGLLELQFGERWVQIANYATADGGFVSLRSDITSIKRTEQALRESEARLRTVFDNSPVGIFLAGTDGTVVFRNRVFAALTGAAERDGRRHAWLSHVHEEERAWIGARWYEYVSAASDNFDIEYRTADAPERIVRLRATPVVEQGQTLGFAGTLEDISAQRQAELEQHRLQLQLQQAQKMDAIGHLTGGIAHDFNNILASILGYAALAGERKTTLDDSKLVNYLDAIRQSGERARELVAKMLAFSRSEPREVVTPTAVQPLVGEAVKLLKAIIPSSIHIVTVVDPGLPPVLVDGVDLHQAIVNLAVNARDSIGGHGQITIGVRAPRQIKGHCASCRENFGDRYVEISVSDTGSGIAPEHLSRLFEPFFSTKEVGKGTGMGLAVTHGVIHRVGGHILVESSPGAGTTLRLLLRSATPLVRAVPPAAAPAVTPVHGGARVLVVDDEPLVMGLIAEVLETQGYDVVGYTDSRQALAWARGADARFDLLVTDQTMPGLTGVELARELLAMRPELPIILCTGFSESVDARVAAAMGIKHFFTKPIPLERLVAAVDVALGEGAAPAVA